MRQLFIKGIALTGLVTVGLSSCQSVLPEAFQTQIEEGQQVVQNKITEEMQNVFRQQINEFIQNDDLETSIGLSEEEKNQMQQSVDSFLEEYDWNTLDYEELKREIVQILQSFSKDKTTLLTKEEIDEKLNEILKK